MKTLQNNFTTPEQSKRLLELGVPADSADAYYDRDEVEIDEMAHPYIIPSNRTFANYDERFYIPCWSVGRLMEIINICYDDGTIFSGFRFNQYENILHTVIDTLVYLLPHLDFSKLDE